MWTGAAWQRGDPSPPRSRPPEAPGGHMVGGSRQPPGAGRGSPRERPRELGILGRGKPEARILITPESPLRAYVSVPLPYGPPELSPQLRCEVRRPAGVSSALPCRAAGKPERPRRLDGSPTPAGRADSAVQSRAQSSTPRPVRFTLSLPAPLRWAGERRRRPPGRTSTTY
ncbi:uncharacterized protein LOC111161196 [Enhydra lutris kenyoni]|uniref:Uncharacterized protein LOC111161196 n=1 Tax=Enhydra lutris kenyoni TaxID=391180 RepID=A0A2Y9L3L1_ENHLU|nr:uncharacterized protein LOC111161196 [Enhydra lutris kenyoni]